MAFYLALRQERRRVRRNLRAVLGARSSVLEQLDVLRTFTAYASCLAEGLGAERLDGARARHRMVGKENFQIAMNQGRGLIITTCHTGPWDAAGRVLSQMVGSDRVLIAMRPEPDERARRLHDSVRHRLGVRVAHVGEHPLDGLPLLHHLRAGRGILAVQLDRIPPGTKSLEVTLFGEPFRVPKGPFLLAALAGAPLLPLFARRTGYYDYEFYAGPAIELAERPDQSQLYRAAQLLAAEMERFIRANPTQWFRFGPD
jgi:KDO2-lipid IV(A) lauroyltransferase